MIPVCYGQLIFSFRSSRAWKVWIWIQLASNIFSCSDKWWPSIKMCFESLYSRHLLKGKPLDTWLLSRRQQTLTMTCSASWKGLWESPTWRLVSGMQGDHWLLISYLQREIPVFFPSFLLLKLNCESLSKNTSWAESASCNCGSSQVL